MKIKALAALCKETKRAYLADQINPENGKVERQYLQTGTALYPLDGMPTLNEDTLLTILDVPQDERSEWTVYRADAEGIREFTADNTDDDKPAQVVSLTFQAGGYDVQPIYTPWGMVTISADTRKPIADSKKTAEYFARRKGERITIIVKNGFMLIAAIRPIQKWATDSAVEYLADIAECAARLWKKNTEEEIRREHQTENGEGQEPQSRASGFLPEPQQKLQDDNRRGVDDLLL